MFLLLKDLADGGDGQPGSFPAGPSSEPSQVYPTPEVAPIIDRPPPPVIDVPKMREVDFTVPESVPTGIAPIPLDPPTIRPRVAIPPVALIEENYVPPVLIAPPVDSPVVTQPATKPDYSEPVPTGVAPESRIVTPAPVVSLSSPRRAPGVSPGAGIAVTPSLMRFLLVLGAAVVIGALVAWLFTPSRHKA